MKKIFALMIVVMMMTSMFVGCASGNAPETTPTSTDNVTNPVTEPTTSQKETSPAVQAEEFINEVSLFDECKTMLEAEDAMVYAGDAVGGIEAFRDMGFTEVGFAPFTPSEPEFTIGTKDDMGIMQFQLSGMNWTLIALKNTGNDAPAIALPEGAWVRTQEDHSFGATSIQYAWLQDPNTDTEKYGMNVVFYNYFQETQNLYLIYTDEVVVDNDSDNIVQEPTALFTMQWSDAELTTFVDWLMYSVAASPIKQFTIKTGDETKTYDYRQGMTVAEWAHSELNTDGWRISIYSDTRTLSKDFQYSLNSQDYIKGSMTAIQNYDIDEEKQYIDESQSHKYRTCSLYCVDSTSPLQIKGAMLRSEKCPENNYDVYFQYQSLTRYFEPDDIIDIGLVGVRESDMEHISIIAVENPGLFKLDSFPYENSFETVKTKGVELPVEYVKYSDYQTPTMENLELRYPKNRGILTAKYDVTENADAIVTGYGLDFAIAYDGEIVYWIFGYPV